jgi:hypothetical protein
LDSPPIEICVDPDQLQQDQQGQLDIDLLSDLRAELEAEDIRNPPELGERSLLDTFEDKIKHDFEHKHTTTDRPKQKNAAYMVGRGQSQWDSLSSENSASSDWKQAGRRLGQQHPRDHKLDQTSVTSKGSYTSPKPKDDNFDTLHEYFPLGLDDWMPPADVVAKDATEFMTTQTDEEVKASLGRGRREEREEREEALAKYDDGLTVEQLLKAVDYSDADHEAAIVQKGNIASSYDQFFAETSSPRPSQSPKQGSRLTDRSDFANEKEDLRPSDDIWYEGSDDSAVSRATSNWRRRRAEEERYFRDRGKNL